MNTTKRNRIIYWIFTVWLCFGLASAGIVQIIGLEEEVEMVVNLGFPEYIIPFLGVSKILAIIAILLPRLPRLKEWAYAGIVFNMLGAIYAHVAMGSEWFDVFGPSLFIVLCMLSWYFRPEGRKV